MLPVGSLIAGYRVERLLGSGGMGTVYLVANPELPRLDALKLLSGSFSRDDQFRSRFIREADVASRMSHPNIVAIYRRGQTEDGQLWIAMQYVEGINADEAVQRGQMSPQRAVHIVTEIGKALDYAHRHSVIHRDVKPANFLLENTTGPDERVLLGDFGIARALDEVSLTVSGSMTATVAYAAPEVVSGRRVDGRADLYSLGCTLFRMFTGKTPFEDVQGVPATIMAHIAQPPPRVTDQAPWLSPAMDAVIARAMAKDPAARFATAAELSAAAQAALRQPAHGGAPPRRGSNTATPTLGAPSLPAEPRRRRAKRIAALAGVALLAAGAAGGLVFLSHRTNGPPTVRSDSTTTTTTRTTTTETRPPIVNAATLSGFLLSPVEIANMMGVTGMPVVTPLQSPSEDATGVEQTECSGALFAIQVSAYKDTGWVAIQAQVLQNTPTAPTHRVAQAVVAMPTATDAQNLLATQSDTWSKCAGTRVTVNFPQPPTPQYWMFGDLTKTDEMMSITYTLEGGGGLACQRAVEVDNNLLIDTLVCRIDPANKAVDIANAIKAKIPS